MDSAQIVMSVLFIFLVIMIGLCVYYAFKKSKNVSHPADNNDKVVTRKRTVPDIEDLDLRKMFTHYKKK